jgi:mannosyltransferase OCH1-like enzyme
MGGDFNDNIGLTVWTDEKIYEDMSIYELIGHLLPLVRFPAMRSDIVRLAVIYEYGGIWTDLKNRCLAPILDDLLLGPTFVSEHPPTVEHAKSNRYLCNAFFGARKGDEFIRSCLQEVGSLISSRSMEYKGVFSTTGPGMFQRVFLRHLALYPEWNYKRLRREDVWQNKITRTSASYNAGGRHWRDRQNNEDMYTD